MNLVRNPFRQSGPLAPDIPFPSIAVENVADLLKLCPAARQTALIDVPGLAPVESVWVKDERARMNLGSFKALGAAYVIARHAMDRSASPDEGTLSGRTYVTASAGNHGMSVAAGARIFGANAVVYVADTVPQTFIDRLRAQGAQVVVQGNDYAASMSAAAAAANENGWTLLSDSSWQGYTELPHLLMEGYLQMAAEVVRQCPEIPSHVLLQAGVGGLAGSVAVYLRSVWAETPTIIVVEPENAPALQASIEAGNAVFADGPESIMGRLDCKEPSLIALNGLARDADCFLTISDEDVEKCLPQLTTAGLETTASGAAGLAAVMSPAARELLEISSDAQALCFLTEEPQ
ncbi:MAG: pyridoxal-phosphate dependent enzyme [Pseudomonadota bacterium]